MQDLHDGITGRGIFIQHVRCGEGRDGVIGRWEREKMKNGLISEKGIKKLRNKNSGV